MSKFYINLQNIKLNISKNIPMSGTYSIIAKNSNNITSNNNSISGNILADNSNYNISNTNNLDNKTLLFANNNSLIKSSNSSSSNIFSENNSFINFPIQKNINNLTDISSISKYTSYEKINDSNYFLHFETIENNKISNFSFSKQLLNNGNSFLFEGKTINDLLFNCNIIDNYIIINLYNVTTNLQNHLNTFPKNLKGKTLKIILTTNSSYSDTITCSGFYNGNILIYGNNNTTLHKFIFKNLLSLYLNNIIFSESVKNYMPLIYMDSVDNAYISGCTFSKLDYDADNVNYLNTNYDYATYKNNIYTIYTIGHLSGVANLFVNSNVIIRDSKYNHCNLVNIIASLNNKIISYNNIFNFNNITYENTLKGFRKILFYGIANSLINSSNCSATISNITFDDNDMYSINTQIDKILSNNNYSSKKAYEVNRLTFLYGYVHPGSIFNHYHKDNILKKQQFQGIDNISHYSLPIGSIYGIAATIKTNDNLLTNNIYQFDNTSTYFGNHELGTNPFIGNSYVNGYYQYNSLPAATFLKKYKSFLNDVNNIKNTGLLPITTYEKRYKNEYIENIKYAYVFKWHFNLKSFYYFNSNLASPSSIAVSTPSSVLSNFFKADNTTIQTIQYSKFTCYNKSSYYQPNVFVLQIEIKRK